jgi:hypothetical protein
MLIYINITRVTLVIKNFCPESIGTDYITRCLIQEVANGATAAL